MALIPHISAILAYHKKVTVTHKKTLEVAVAEIRVFKITKSLSYPEGIKYSLFLVSLNDNKVIVGMDNHKPKGPHLHRNGQEIKYKNFPLSEYSLVVDFWKMVEEEGFET